MQAIDLPVQPAAASCLSPSEEIGKVRRAARRRAARVAAFSVALTLTGLAGVGTVAKAQAPAPGTGGAPGRAATDPPGAPPIPPLPGAPAIPPIPPAPPIPGPPTGAEAAPPASGAKVGDAEITSAQMQYAERLTSLAQDALQSGAPGDFALLRQTAAALKAAGRLSSAEPRYPRLLAEAMTEAGDTAGAIDALNAYRKIRFEQKMPPDLVAQVRLIELYVSQIETVDGRIGYLGGLVGRASLPPEVQSHAAAMAVPLLEQRSRAAALDMVKEAVRLNPLNLRARRQEYELLLSGTPAPDAAARAGSLLAMVRCKAQQPDVVTELARLLGDVGLASDSLEWFGYSLALAQRMPGGIDPNLLDEYAIELYLAGRGQEADAVIGKLLEASPVNVQGWFVRLTMDRGTARKVAYDQELDWARQVMASRAVRIARQALAGSAATQPAGGKEDQVSSQILEATIKALTAPGADAGLRAEFVSTLSDLAWFEVYFNASADQGRVWITALKRFLPASDITVRRLDGWLDLISGRREEARKKLAPLQEDDALAALGMIQLLSPVGGPTTAPATTPTSGPGVAPAGRQPPSSAASTQPAGDVAAIGQRLLGQYRSGLVGMTIAAALRERNLTAPPHPAAAGVQAALARFPKDWMQIISNPTKFYIVVGGSSKLSYRLGEPMMAQVTLQNVGSEDISVGADGTVGPDLWFDAKVSFANEAQFPMAAYDKVSDVLVLKPRQTSSQWVKLNQGSLGEALRSKPAGSFNVYPTMMTNPVAMGSRVLPGPGGVRRQFPRSLVRAGAPISSDAQKNQLYAALNGLPAEKMWAIDVLAAYLFQARQKDAEGRVLALANEFRTQIDKSRGDAVPHVAAWAAYQIAQLSEPAARAALINPLAASDRWEIRLLSLIAAAELAPAEQKKLAQSLANDPEEVVKMAAAQRLILADHPTTRPAAPAEAGPADPTGEPSPATPASPGGPTPPVPGPALPPGGPASSPPP